MQFNWENKNHGKWLYLGQAPKPVASVHLDATRTDTALVRVYLPGVEGVSYVQAHNATQVAEGMVNSWFAACLAIRAPQG